jgi:hypothetical protein
MTSIFDLLLSFSTGSCSPSSESSSIHCWPRYEASTPCWSQTTVSIISSSSIGKIKNRSRGDRSYYAAVLKIKVLWTVHHLAFPHFPDVCQFFVSEIESIVAARLVPYANSVNNRAPAQLIQSYMIQGERYPAGGAVKANGNL